jgi:putative redox protein
MRHFFRRGTGKFMKARVFWLENAKFLGESGSGHTVVMDGPPESGGQNLGVRPMEMLLLGMGGCTAFDVVHILRKGRHDVTGCELQLEAERADTDPKVFTNIRVRYVVTGKGLTDAAVKRAIDLSAEKYCSASIMLGKSATITHEYTIVEA